MNGMIRGCGLWLVALSVIAGGASGAWAQGGLRADESADGVVKPLAAKQEMIRDRLRRLQDRMFRLRETLAETEPETAAKLAKALERIGQVGVEEKVRLLIEMLADEARVSRAGEVQAALAEDLEGVLALLLARRDRDARQRRTERLQQSRRAVREVLEQQRALRAETAEALAQRERARQIGDALERLEKLIGRQEGLRADAADEDGSAGQEAFKRSAEAQRNLSGDAQALAEDVRAIGDGSEEGDPGGQNPSGAEEQTETGQAGGATAEAAEAIEQASRAMERAAEGLAGGQTNDGEDEQKRALERLERARHRLEEAKESATRERAATPDQAAGRQQAAADRARAIAKQMGGESEGSDRGRPGGEQQPGGDPNDPRQGRQKPMPGQHNVEEAGRQMDDAAEDLNRDQPEQAIPNQDRAAEELEEALGKLEDELQQLRREERLELLGDLESRFAEMLNRQVSINEATVAIEERRGEPLDRSNRLALAELSERQGALADRAATCLHILEEDGTTVVFPRIVEQVGRDMRAVAERLAQLRSGALTQTLQEGIVSALGELVEAVRRNQESEQQQGQPQGQGAPQSDEAPLLPGSAELKLLKVAQLRINERTAAVHTARQSGVESDKSLGRVLEGLLVRQRALAEAARDMRDKTE
ncbi:MAG: hypothetical protein IID40_03855 [Planctomycetes bacterium]|nr:hypothetical protein [Planctomycetota bacterium]